MRSDYLHKWVEFEFWSEWICAPSTHMETLRQMVFVLLAFCNWKLIYFPLCFYTFFCSYFIGFQICSGRAWVDSKPSGRRGKFWGPLWYKRGRGVWLATFWESNGLILGDCGEGVRFPLWPMKWITLCWRNPILPSDSSVMEELETKRAERDFKIRRSVEVET